MKPQEFPIHMNCPEGSVAPIVIMPGDPLRAKYIAEKFLTDVQQITSIRNMLGFTGNYKGQRVTVMGHGMGMPSAGIYVFELFYYYNVQKIIRIGTCGVVTPDIKVPEIVLADCIYSESNFAYQYNGYDKNIVYPSKNLVEKIIATANSTNKKLHIGTGMTCDVFGPYVDIDAILNRVPEGINPIVEEMEGFGICHIANSFNREAACLYTAVDSKFSEDVLSPEERERSLDEMITLALDSLI